MLAKTAEAMNSPPARWDNLIPRPIDNETITVTDELFSVAIEAVRRAAYFNARGMGKDHNAAGKESNRIIRSVTKTLGYSYPKSHELSF